MLKLVLCCLENREKKVPKNLYRYLTVVESLMLEIPEKFFLQNSPGLPFSMYIIMVRRKNALKNKITEKTEFVYF